MKKVIFAASLVGTLMITEFAQAQARFNSRNQHQRIEQGVRSGRLTPMEARQLKIQQQRIALLKRRAMAHGFISPRERMMSRNAEKNANVAIYTQKHDRDFRW
jgi:hypothetical protein